MPVETLEPQDPLQEVITAVQGFYARKDRAHDLEHALRVRQWGRKLAEEEDADVTIVELAALLHDIGRSGTVEKSHAESSAGLAITILKKAGYTETQIERVKEAIISHSREGGHEPATLEAKILYDADKLDFVGAIGLGRLFTLAGVNGWPFVGENSCETFYLERIRGYQAHLFTKTALGYFTPLLHYMEDFWRELHAERFKMSSKGQTNS